MISKIGFYIALLLCITCSTLFFIFPQIDISTSAVFYHNTHFFNPAWMKITRNLLTWLIYTIVITLIILAIYNLIRKKYPLLKPTIYLLLCFALGSGLLVNIVLKNHWGRPRPHSISQFGGHKTYQKPWVISNECNTNCSFVAGEPSTAFALFAFLALFKKRENICYPTSSNRARKPRPYNTGKITTASLLTLNWLLFSFIRIAQGGHFFSDVIIGATLVYMLIYCCYYLVFGEVQA